MLFTNTAGKMLNGTGEQQSFTLLALLYSMPFPALKIYNPKF